jgi:uncharacterized protein YwgA
MKIEKFMYLAGIIAAHEGGEVVGRTRLQKTVKLLQRVGLPTDYDYVLFFYGPYSEGVKSDLGLLGVLELVEEEEHANPNGNTWYTIRARTEVDLAALRPYLPKLKKLEQSDAVPLELAATYDMFRELGSDHTEALARLRRKKAEKCTKSNVAQALSLLGSLGLPNN